MAYVYVDSYRTCDVCGCKLHDSIEEEHFRIEPTLGSKIKMNVWKYWGHWTGMESSIWCRPIDMCQDCWNEMRNIIIERRIKE